MTGALHSFSMTPSLGTLGVQEDGDGVTPHKCSVFASWGCRRRAELMALLCRAGLIFWRKEGRGSATGRGNGSVNFLS